jgi:hypothetical protein
MAYPRIGPSFTWWAGRAEDLGPPNSTERAIQSGSKNAALASLYESLHCDASRSLLLVRKARDQLSAPQETDALSIRHPQSGPSD